MMTPTPPVNSGVPETIQSAERWRVAGARLRRLAPAVFDDLFAMLVMANTRESDEVEGNITESYYLT